LLKICRDIDIEIRRKNERKGKTQKENFSNYFFFKSSSELEDWRIGGLEEGEAYHGFVKFFFFST